MVSVLVVDDRDSNRLVLRLWCQMQGCAVAEAVNGEAARDLVLATPVQVILCDLEMPNGDGLWLYAQIRDLVRERGILFIFVCAPRTQEQTEAIQATGCKLFVKGSAGVGPQEIWQYVHAELRSQGIQLAQSEAQQAEPAPV